MSEREGQRDIGRDIETDRQKVIQADKHQGMLQKAIAIKQRFWI